MHITWESVLYAVEWIVIGGVAGTLGSLVGLGGGFVIVPLMTFLYGVPSRFVAGTSTAVIVINALASSLVYRKQRRIDVRSGLAFAAASVPGAFVGARISTVLPARQFDLWFGILMICVSLLLLFKPAEIKRPLFPPTTTRTLVDASGNTHTYRFNLWFGVAASFFVGFLSSLFGIGGGVVMVPTMVLLLGFPAHIAVATSMFNVLVSSVVGAVSHAFEGNILWIDAAFLAIGAWVGGQLGPRLSSRVSATWLLRFLSILMIVAAIRFVLP